MTHADDLKLKLLLKGELDSIQSAELMQHISECDECAEHFSDLTLSMATIEPPSGLYEEVLAAAAKEQSTQQKKQESLLMYSIRVIAGICAAIVMLFSGLFEKITKMDFDMSKVSDAGRSISDGLNEGINNIADKLFNWEDKTDDKKE
ncbi:MAG: hypothetical protein IJF40_07260 [Clostridia bacterium]|nr:hypothetical protein [Clostridia bacterium]